MDVDGVKWWEEKDKEYDPDNLMDLRSFLTAEVNLEWFRKMHTLEQYICDENGIEIADYIFDPSTDEVGFKNYMLAECGLDLRDKNILRLNITSKPESLIDEAKTCFSDSHIFSNIEEIFAFEISRFDYKNPFV